MKPKPCSESISFIDKKGGRRKRGERIDFEY